MPTYRYRCENKKCKQALKEFERMASIAERHEQSCEVCGSKLMKLIDAPTLIGFDGLGRS